MNFIDSKYFNKIFDFFENAYFLYCQKNYYIFSINSPKLENICNQKAIQRVPMSNASPNRTTFQSIILMAVLNKIKIFKIPHIDVLESKLYESIHQLYGKNK